MARKKLRKYSRIDLLERMLKLQRRIDPESSAVRWLEREIRRLRDRRRFLRALARMAALLLAVALLSLGFAWRMPVLRITDASMAPGLNAGAYVIAARDIAPQRGDLIAFEREEMLLVRRMIAVAGDEVCLRQDGTLLVNGQTIAEDYVSDPSAGVSEISFPYLVPQNTVFVLGDNRLESVDSRHKAVGVIREDEILGRIWAQFWPFDGVQLF